MKTTNLLIIYFEQRRHELSDKEKIEFIKSQRYYGCVTSSYPGIKEKKYVLYDLSFHKLWKLKDWLPFIRIYKEFLELYPRNKATYLRKMHNIPNNSNSYIYGHSALYKKYHIVTPLFRFKFAVRLFKFNKHAII